MVGDEMKSIIGIGIYGGNGHQIHPLLENHPQAELLAYSHISLNEDFLVAQKGNEKIVNYASLQEMVTDPRISLISLCSPYRKDQAKDAIFCLKAGKHVYAEKPCALNEAELDEIIETARSTGCLFHEMAGTAFEQPYLSMRNLVIASAIGEVVQVFAQKSYPYHERRPQDEDIDGGLIGQAGIYLIRFIEHVALQKVTEVNAVETRLGNPDSNGELHMAASLIMRLENGGVAGGIANYLNPKGFNRWGNEHLRIFGTLGFMEMTNGGLDTRLVVGDHDMGRIEQLEPTQCYFTMFLMEIMGRGIMPFKLEDELHPTRMIIRAKKACRANLTSSNDQSETGQ
jgi:predicted dehydrogenase